MRMLSSGVQTQKKEGSSVIFSSGVQKFLGSYDFVWLFKQKQSFYKEARVLSSSSTELK